jgi:glycosyltransferase involved in cell wall biosynthesis
LPSRAALGVHRFAEPQQYVSYVRSMLAFRRRSDYFLAVVDIGLGLLAGWVAYSLRFGDVSVPGYFVVRYEALTVGLAVGSVFAGRAAGLYKRGVLRAGESTIEAAVESSLAVGLAVFLINQFALHGAPLSRAWIGLVTLALLLFSIASRSVIRRSRRLLVPFGLGRERYAVVGDDAAGRRLRADLTRAPGAPFTVVALLDRDLAPEEVLAQARTLRLDGLILTADADPVMAGSLAGAVSGEGVDVLLAPGLSGLEMRVASVAMLHGVPLLRATGLAPHRRAVRVRASPRRRGVAILGTRGIPANYGGFETFAERLALYLVSLGIPVTVYCRRHHATEGHEWRGVRLVTLPTITTKYLDTVVHTFLSTLHLLTRTRIRDVVVCNAANAPALPLLRVTGRRVVMNVDGLEWRRGKWGMAGRAWYRLGEWLSVRLASVLVTDAEEVRTYYRVRHDTDSVMVPYGADPVARGLSLPAELDVEPDRYVLYVARWERENNPDLVARAHAAAHTETRLVMLGQATYDPDLDREVRNAAAPTAVLPGPVFGEAYVALQSNARCYVHATEVGGTHPALIEAMGARNLCLVLDTPENREVAGPDAWYFGDEHDLSVLLTEVDHLDEEHLTELREATGRRAAELFSWSRVGEAYLGLLRGDVSPAH